jgi:outer membrane protein TolC
VLRPHQLDLLQAQDSLVSAEVAVAQARFDLGLSDLQLKRTAGQLPDLWR